MEFWQTYPVHDIPKWIVQFLLIPVSASPSKYVRVTNKYATNGKYCVLKTRFFLHLKNIDGTIQQSNYFFAGEVSIL